MKLHKPVKQRKRGGSKGGDGTCSRVVQEEEIRKQVEIDASIQIDDLKDSIVDG